MLSIGSMLASGAPVAPALGLVARRGFHAARTAYAGADSLFLTGHKGGGSSAPIVVGLMQSLSRYVSDIGYFRPIASAPHEEDIGLPKGAADPHVELVHSVFTLRDDKNTMTGVSYSKAVDYIASGKEDELMDQILAAYQRYRQGKSFVVVEGTPLQAESIGFEINMRIAQMLETPMLLALHHDEYKTTQQVITTALMTKRELMQKKIDLLGVLVNRVERGEMHGLSRECSKAFSDAGIPFAGVLPRDRILGSIRLNEVAASLNAKLLYGKESFNNDIEISQLLVATLQLPELLDFLVESVPVTPGAGPLVFTSADRLDLLTGLMYARESVNMPNVAGIVLTGGKRPPRFFDQIIKGISKDRHTLPVFIVDSDTFHTVTIANKVKGHMLPTSRKKIEWATAVWDDYIDDEVIRKALSKEKIQKITPKLFQHRLVEGAKANRQHIVLPEGQDWRVLTAASDLLRNDICDITILGEHEKIQLEATRLGLDLSHANIVWPPTDPKTKEYAQLLFELRKSKGMTLEAASDLAQDLTYYGTLMVESGDADGMVSGAIHTTANTIRPALQIIKSLPDRPTVSSVFFMLLPDKVLVYGDCAINVNPTSEELAQIAVTSAETARAFGLHPRVAMLSYATGDSNSGPLIDKVRKGVELAKELAPDEMIEGPLQYDASVDPEVAKTKVKGESKVAGKANVLIFPDLNTGNNTYKAVQQSTGAIAMGPVLQGLRKPVNDLSRGCTVVDIYNTVVMTALQAIQMKQTAEAKNQ